MHRLVLLVVLTLAAAGCSSSEDPAPAPRCAADADCDDGVHCNGAETCDVAGDRCVRGAPPACDDGVACTIDLCDEARLACAHLPDAGACGAGEACSATEGCGPAPECAAAADCDDGFFCNGAEICGADLRCAAGVPPSCDDGVACTVDFCDDLVDRCARVADAWACLPGDRCTPQGCAPVPECTADADCDDGLFCNGAETCDAAAGRCLPGARPDCDDAIACTVDVCDEVLARCQHVSDAARCAGGEVCSPVAGCRTPPACATDADCDDGLFCNGAETCDLGSGRCAAGAPPACADAAACTLDVCDEQARTCRHLDEPGAAGCARLAVVRAGDGAVSSSPAGIACGSACDAWFAPGTVVTLAASPDPAAAFSGWSGACAGTGSCVVTMDAARSVQATFTRQTYALTVSRTAGGTVVSSPAGLYCGASCSATFDAGAAVTLTAVPEPGATFAGWSGACSGTGTCTVSMTSAKSVSARFTFPVTVTRAGAGAGTVTSAPAGISCGATCSASYDAGITVTLTATPDATSTFAGWSGACAGTGTCTLSLGEAKAVTATFARPPQALTVSRMGAGTVVSSPLGILCGAACSASFEAGTVVTLTAQPDAGAALLFWAGCDATSGPTCTVTMANARSVSATFTYPLSVAKAGTGGGTVSSSPAGINCGTACAAGFAPATTVMLTATADATSTFAGWTGACSGVGSCAVTMDGAKSVTATFTRNAYALSVSRTGGGTVVSTPAGIHCGAACSATFDAGSAVTLVAEPDEFWTFAGWTGACSGTGSCTLTMSAARSVTATFVRTTFQLTVSKSGAGTGTVTSSPAGIDCGATCSATFEGGAYVALATTPGPISTFAGWSGACSGTGTCLVRMDAARSVTATFTSP